MSSQAQAPTRGHSESRIQRDIELGLGAEPDLLLLRNNVGVASHDHVNAAGKPVTYRVAYGLGVGSPDLVALLTVQATSGPRAFWFCLEIKVPGERATAEQAAVHANWRRFGAWVEVVHSVSEARASLDRARVWARSGWASPVDMSALAAPTRLDLIAKMIAARLVTRFGASAEAHALKMLETL